jgi:predicted nuclease of predicted toxin-antitoxin system
VKFLVDMPLSPALAQWLQGQGHDAVHAASIGLAAAPDTTILAHAKQDGRIVVNADLDYPRILALTAADGPAVILFRGGDWNERQTINRLSAALSAIPEAELTKSLVAIEKFRVRRRALPL